MRAAALAMCCVLILCATSSGTRASLADDATTAPSITATITPASDTPTDLPSATEQATPASTAADTPAPAPTDTPTPPAETPAPTLAPPPVRTATSTPTAGLSGSGLLSRMRSAISAAKTVHLVFTDRIHPVKNTTVLTTTMGDVSWRGNRLHESTTVVRSIGASSQTTVEQRYEVKIVGSHAAWRPGNLSWTCQGLMNVRVITTLQAMRTPLNGVRRLPDIPTDTRITEHVRATVVSLALAGSPRPTIDFYIDGSTHLPLRVTETTPSTNHLTPETVTETYSQWGHLVKVNLPSKCR
jgi:hypothetical protein